MILFYSAILLCCFLHLIKVNRIVTHQSHHSYGDHHDHEGPYVHECSHSPESCQSSHRTSTRKVTSKASYEAKKNYLNIKAIQVRQEQVGGFHPAIEPNFLGSTEHLGPIWEKCRMERGEGFPKNDPVGSHHTIPTEDGEVWLPKVLGEVVGSHICNI